MNIEYSWIVENALSLQQSLQNKLYIVERSTYFRILAGISFRNAKAANGCQIQVFPDPHQHRRRFEGTINPLGEVPQLVEKH